MTTGNTTLLGLALPVEGELDGTWGDVVNASITSLLDSAIAGTTTLSADSDATLTDTVLAANQARQAVILWTASNGATTRNITAPARSKAYVVINAGTGSVVLRGAGPTTGVTIVSGERCLAAWNGSDFVKIATSVADGVTSVGGTGTVNGITLTGTVTSTGNLTLGGALTGVNLATQVTGTLPIANGGTGTTSTQFTNLATNVTGTLPVANGGTGSTSSTGTGSVVLSNSPTLITPALGTPASGTLTNATGLPIDGGTTGILPVGRGGSGTATPALVQGTGITISGSWPNQTIAANNAGTVTSVTGTAPVVSSGGATPAISMAAATASNNGFMTSTYAAKLDGIAAGATNVTNTNQLTNGANFVVSGGALGTPSSGTLTNCTFPTLNQNTTGTAASTPRLLTTNFTIEESGGKLVFKYGGTTIASMDSSGNIISAANVTAFGTP